MIYAQKLQKNDLVGICAPASPVDREILQKGIQFIKGLGLQVVLGKNIYKKNHYLAGTDEQRLEDFNTFLKDDNVKAILFARGGYGTARIAPMINYELIRTHPKIIWGFSDITYLHTAIFQQTGLITFHGPIVTSIGNEQFDELTANEFNQLFSPSVRTYDESISPLQVLVEGEGAGRIVGGNLSLIVSTIGTPYEINVKDKILFIEDTGEKLYKIDSLINQLKQSQKLNELKGIVIGDFKDVFLSEDVESLTFEHNEKVNSNQNGTIQRTKIVDKTNEKKGRMEKNDTDYKQNNLVKNKRNNIESHHTEIRYPPNQIDHQEHST